MVASLGRTVPNSVALACLSPYESEFKDSCAAWADGVAEGALMAFSEDMVREIQVIRSNEEVPELLKSRSDAGAELQMVLLPEGTTAEVGRRLEQYLGGKPQSPLLPQFPLPEGLASQSRPEDLAVSEKQFKLKSPTAPTAATGLVLRGCSAS